jgi:hypothetical protein
VVVARAIVRYHHPPARFSPPAAMKNAAYP